MTETDMEKFAQSLIGKSPYEIYKAIRDFDNKKGKGAAMAVLQQSKDFGDFCSQQLHAFLDNRLALTQRDAENIDKWWKFSTNNFSIEEIQIADAKAFNGNYIRSEHYVDFDNNKIIKSFVKNIPDINEEMNIFRVEGDENIRIQQRQRIVDFIRLANQEENTANLIEKNNWQPLIREFDGFPKMDARYITRRYDRIKQYNAENPNKVKSEAEAFYARILSYILNDICHDFRKSNLEEIEFLRTYLKTNKLESYDELVAETLNKLDILKQKYGQEKQPNYLNVDFIEDENISEQKQEQQLSSDEKVQTENKSDEKMQTENEVDKIDSSEKNQVENINKENLDIKTKAEEKILPIVKEKEQEPDKDKENSIATSWQNKALTDWKDWGKNSNKIVQEYKSEDKSLLAFKIYDNAEKAKADEFDADITYRKENDVTVKGYKGKIPSDDVFAAIVSQAKKNGQEIFFGNIKNNIFKAKLMLACLNDKDVKMVNQPKLSDLTDLPEDLKAKLKEKLPRPTDRAKDHLNKLNEEKNGRPHSDSDNKGSYEQKNGKSYDKQRRSGKFRSDNNSGERKSFRPRRGNAPLSMKRDNQYE